VNDVLSGAVDIVFGQRNGPVVQCRWQQEDAGGPQQGGRQEEDEKQPVQDHGHVIPVTLFLKRANGKTIERKT